MFKKCNEEIDFKRKWLVIPGGYIKKSEIIAIIEVEPLKTEVHLSNGSVITCAGWESGKILKAIDGWSYLPGLGWTRG